MKEETKTKVKSWFKKNWAYVVIGAVAVGTVVVSVMSNDSSDETPVDPYVIDRSKDDWMDILKVPYLDSKITVRQASNLCNYYEWMLNYIQTERDCCLNGNTESDAFVAYDDLFPDEADNILLAWT